MNVGLMQIAEIFCPVMIKIEYIVHNHARVHTVSSYVSVIIEPFLSFCVINMPKRRLKFFESLDPSMTKPYRLVFITRLRGAWAFVQSSRRVTQSFGVDEESRHLRTPTN